VCTVLLGGALGACGSSGNPSTFDAGTAGGDATADDGGSDATATCPSGQASCNGACVDLSSDPKNCGTCGTWCGAGICCQGTCVDQTSSCAFAVLGATPLQGNVNGGDWIKLEGNGFGPGLQVLLGDGHAPAMALDAHTAIVQTPPAPAGQYDVTVVQATQKAVLPGAFRYVTGSEMLPWLEKPMMEVRGEDPGLAVLQDGRVLIVGGTTVPDHPEDALTSAEIFTRATETVAPAANAMSTQRWHSSAITLLDGRVLVVGAAPEGSPATLSPAADLFDPTTNQFKPTSHALNTPRGYTRSVLMTDGRVLISSASQQTAEIYDPATDAFTQIPQLAIHTFGFMVRLRDGRVLLGGGDGGQTACEIYDPATGKFATAAPLNQGRSMLTAHTLPDGRVMVIGGASLSAGGVHAPLDTMELYDPKADKWTVAPYKLSTGRCWHASALVHDGTILVMGGYNVDQTCTPTNTVDQVDPVAGTVKSFGTLPHANTEWTAVTMLDGSVLGVGGGACGTSTALPDLDFLPGAGGAQ